MLNLSLPGEHSEKNIYIIQYLHYEKWGWKGACMHNIKRHTTHVLMKQQQLMSGPNSSNARSFAACLTTQQDGLSYWALWWQHVLLLRMAWPTVISLFCQPETARAAGRSSALRRTGGVQQLHLVKETIWAQREEIYRMSQQQWSNVMLCWKEMLCISIHRKPVRFFHFFW